MYFFDVEAVLVDEAEQMKLFLLVDLVVLVLQSAPLRTHA